MSLHELATTDEAVWSVPKAGALFGRGRTASYEMVGKGLPTIRLNGRLVVPVPLLRQLLGLSEEAPSALRTRQGPEGSSHGQAEGSSNGSSSG